MARVGRFRVIRTGGRSYIGRKVMEQPVQSVVRRAPATAHPELDGDPAYKQAEACWHEREPGQALPFYQSALIEREKVLPADDPATLRVVAVDEQDLDAHDPQLLRDRAALGASHPDTTVYRTALVEACQVAEARGKKREVQAAQAARRLLTDEAAPTST